ncbi:MAG: hypothetical protein HZC28_04780 [Spirochaetes bacterium]|nr:hypothetical protein [Spirochaetota bacterium]
MRSGHIIFSLLIVCAAVIAAPSHRFMKSGCNAGSVAIVGVDGNIEWEYPIADETSDSWLLENGNVIFSYKKGVREVRPDKTTAWEYTAAPASEVHACQPLDNGFFLIGESYTNGTSLVCEMSRDGTKRLSFIITNGGNAHNQFRQIRKTPQGTYLISLQRGGGVSKEYDASGTCIRTFPGGRYAAVRLADGNTLIACGDEHRLIEVNAANEIVWEVKQNDIPGVSLGFVAGVQRLANGNTVICNWSGHGGAKDQAQVIEITREKTLAWELRDARLKMISSITILDESGAGNYR